MDPPLKSWIAGETGLVTIEYHTSFPYLGDPFYQANIAEQQERLLASGVTFVPSMRFDALHTPGGNDPAAYATLLAARRAEPSGATIDMAGTFDPTGERGLLTITVRPEAAMAGDWRLRVAIIENAIDYPAPNGIDIHQHVFRDFLPDPAGTSIELAGAMPVVVDLDYQLDPAWNGLHVRFVAFIQEEVTRVIDQGAELRVDELTPVAAATWGGIKNLYRESRERP